jgi:hypothetical protein
MFRKRAIHKNRLDVSIQHSCPDHNTPSEPRDPSAISSSQPLALQHKRIPTGAMVRQMRKYTPHETAIYLDQQNF